MGSGCPGDTKICWCSSLSREMHTTTHISAAQLRAPTRNGKYYLWSTAGSTHRCDTRRHRKPTARLWEKPTYKWSTQFRPMLFKNQLHRKGGARSLPTGSSRSYSSQAGPTSRTELPFCCSAFDEVRSSPAFPQQGGKTRPEPSCVFLGLCCEASFSQCFQPHCHSLPFLLCTRPKGIWGSFLSTQFRLRIYRSFKRLQLPLPPHKGLWSMLNLGTWALLWGAMRAEGGVRVAAM